MSSTRRTVLTWNNEGQFGFSPQYLKLLSDHFDVIHERDVTDRPALGSRVDAVLVTAGQSLEIIYERPELFPNLKVMVTMSAGLEHIRLTSIKERGIRLAATASFGDAVAEMALTLLLCLRRNVRKWSRSVQEPTLSRSRLTPGCSGIQSSTVGFVGFGRIGVRAARLVKPHDCTIVYYDPFKSSSDDDNEVGATRYTNLLEMLKVSDNIVLSCSLNKHTSGIIGEKELSCMKPSACLINIARGKLVDTSALIRALQEGRIQSAGLDVTEPENLPSDHPLLTMENVLVTPHCAGSTDGAMEASFRSAVENLLVGVRGEVMPKEIDVATVTQ